MKHLKGQSEPPLVTKNEHFLKLCPEGQLGPPIGDEKVCSLRGERQSCKARREENPKVYPPKLNPARGSHPRPYRPQVGFGLVFTKVSV